MRVLQDLIVSRRYGGARMHTCTSCVWLWSGDRTAPSLHYSLFELLKISHLNSIGKDLFDLFACMLGLTPGAERSCVREHNREPGASNVHLYGYYHGPWGSRWQVAYTLDRSTLSLLGINMRMGGISSKKEEKELRSQSVNGVITNPCSHNHT